MSANWRGCERILRAADRLDIKPAQYRTLIVRQRVALGADPLADDDSGIWEAGNRLAVCSLSVQRFAGGMSQPFDLVLDHQFSALQLKNLQVVC